MKKRIAVYPGSFDPIHNGHLDIICRCRPLYDEICVAVLGNEEKRPLFTVDERVAMLRELLVDSPECRVEGFSGLLVDFMDRLGAQTIVRGLRAVSDFEYEFQMALMNRRLNPNIETVFLTTKEDYSYLSSRLVKEVFSLGGDLSGLVPETILGRLKVRLPQVKERSQRGMSDPVVAATSPAVLELEAGTYYWCSCGQSQKQPFCDGSHKGTEFTPVKFEQKEKGRVALCQCKHTANQPRCDGAHARL